MTEWNIVAAWAVVTSGLLTVAVIVLIVCLRRCIRRERRLQAGLRAHVRQRQEARSERDTAEATARDLQDRSRAIADALALTSDALEEQTQPAGPASAMLDFARVEVSAAAELNLQVLQPSDAEPRMRAVSRLMAMMRTAGLRLQPIETGQRFPLRPGAETLLYRVLREALDNALRHGAAGQLTRIGICWSQGGCILRVENAFATPASASGAKTASSEAVGAVPEDSVPESSVPEGEAAGRAELQSNADELRAAVRAVMLRQACTVLPDPLQMLRDWQVIDLPGTGRTVTLQFGTEPGSAEAGRTPKSVGALRHLSTAFRALRERGLRLQPYEHGKRMPILEARESVIAAAVQVVMEDALTRGGQGTLTRVRMHWSPTDLRVTVSDDVAQRRAQQARAVGRAREHASAKGMAVASLPVPVISEGGGLRRLRALLSLSGGVMSVHVAAGEPARFTLVAVLPALEGPR